MLSESQNIITTDPHIRGGAPCIRGMRITVNDVLSYLASGMTVQQILDDFEYLTEQDINACINYPNNHHPTSNIQHPTSNIQSLISSLNFQLLTFSF